MQTPLTLYKSKGTLHYAVGNTHSLRVVIDPEIARYYRWFIPKWHRTNPQAYAPHISVVRKETPANLEHWGKYEGHEVEFEYSNEIHHSEIYWWLNVYCIRLEEIRAELGLQVHSEITLPPGGFTRCFHATIGNTKHLI